MNWIRKTFAGFVLSTVSALTTTALGQWDAAVEKALAAADGERGGVIRDRVRPQWLPDATRFWYTVDVEDGKQEFVLVDAQSGDIQRTNALANLGLASDEPLRTSALPLRRLRTRTTGAPLRLEFSNRMDRPLKLYWLDLQNRRQSYGELPAGGQRIQNTYEGHVWLVTDEQDQRIAAIEASTLQQSIEIDAPSEAAAVDERGPRSGNERSPDGRWSVDFREHNAILTRLSDGTETRLTEDGDTQHPYRGPVHWSPDSAALVFARVREPSQRRITLVESSPRDQVQPVTREVGYAKPGDDLPQVLPVLFRIGDAEAAGEEQPAAAERMPISDELFPQAFNESGRLSVRWADDSSECYFDYNQRGHQLYRIIALAAGTGATRAVVEEQSETFIDYTNKTWRHWLTERQELLWMSERDGWNHLWLYDVASGTPVRQITQGCWVVHSVQHVDEQRQQIWFLASGLRADEDPYHLHLCRVNFDGSGMLQLTQADGTHEIQWSPDRQWLIATWSRRITRRRPNFAAATTARWWRRWNREMPAGFWPAVGRCRSGSWPKDVMVKLIFTASSSVPNPLILGENIRWSKRFTPDRTEHFTKSFGRLSGQQAFARLGFVVVQVDGMGTNHRGRAFHSIAWKNLQDAGFPDRIAWIRSAAKERPWMDLSRVGIYGGSAGGQTAMRALLDHHDFYQAAAADCGCHDNRIDKRWWNEQWLGWPLDESYTAASNVEHAHRLRGSLLLIVGELDQNVDPASTLQVVDRLVQANKPFEFLLIPGAGHGAAETPYGSRRRLEFFHRHLGASNNKH